MIILLIIGAILLALWLIFVLFRVVFHWMIHLLPLIALILIIIWLFQVAFKS
jgi:hypothetical protein